MGDDSNNSSNNPTPAQAGDATVTNQVPPTPQPVQEVTTPPATESVPGSVPASVGQQPAPVVSSAPAVDMSTETVPEPTPATSVPPVGSVVGSGDSTNTGGSNVPPVSAQGV